MKSEKHMTHSNRSSSNYNNNNGRGGKQGGSNKCHQEYVIGSSIHSPYVVKYVDFKRYKCMRRVRDGAGAGEGKGLVN